MPLQATACPGSSASSVNRVERLLIELQRRFRLAEGRVDPASASVHRASSGRRPSARQRTRGLFIARGGEPLASAPPWRLRGGRLGHQPLGFDALALGGRRLRQLLQTDGVRPRRDARARRQHPDLQRTRRLRQGAGADSGPSLSVGLSTASRVARPPARPPRRRRSRVARRSPAAAPRGSPRWRRSGSLLPPIRRSIAAPMEILPLRLCLAAVKRTARTRPRKGYESSWRPTPILLILLAERPHGSTA